MTDPGRHQHPDLSPETEAEASEEPDEALTLPQDGAPSNQSWTTAGQVLDRLTRLVQIAEDDRRDRQAAREDRERRQVLVDRVTIGALVGGVLWGVALIGLVAILVVITVVG